MINIRDIIGDAEYTITQEQGIPWIRNPQEIHQGIDLAMSKFTPLYAPLDGIITRASYHRSDPVHSFGNRVSLFVSIDGKKLEIYF